MNHPSTDKARERDVIGGLLAVALDMEDQISRGVYEDYRKRENWPSELDAATFQQIEERLSVLIEDTKRHFQILRGLIDEHRQSK